MQDNVFVQGKNIVGDLKFIKGGITETGTLSGDGYFLALKYDADWSKFSSVKVGLEPSQGTGLVELINDPDKNGVAKVAGNHQKIKIVATATNGSKVTETYNLALNFSKE